jgi:tetratricopeptide repeat protein
MTKRVSLVLALALVGCAVPRLLAQPQAVGQLLNVAGRVEIRHGQRPAQKGMLLSPLRNGDLLVARGGASAEVVLFQNGARFLLPARSAAQVEPTALKPRAGPIPKRLKGLSLDFLRQMNRPPSQVGPRILGALVRETGDALLGPRHPSPNGAVRRAPATLRWAGPVEAGQLRLRISDGERTIHRADLPPTAREYQVPAGVLRPGEYYVWSVMAVRGGVSGQRCRALLRVVPPDEEAAVERMEKETAAARALAPNDPSPLLLIAEAYERLGLFDDARSTYQAVLKLRPGDPGVQAALKQLPSDG